MSTFLNKYISVKLGKMQLEMPENKQVAVKPNKKKCEGTLSENITWCCYKQYRYGQNDVDIDCLINDNYKTLWRGRMRGNGCSTWLNLHSSGQEVNI